MLEQEHSSPISEHSPAASEASVDSTSILDEIVREFGPLVDDRERFVAMPMGMMSLLGASEIQELEAKKKASQSSVKPFLDQNTPIGNRKENKESLYAAFTFQDYLTIIRRLQIFQNTQNIAGYKLWLEEGSSQAARLFVDLRKYAKAAQSSHALDWNSKYIELAQKEASAPEEIKGLHQRIRCFDEMQAILIRFRQAMRQQPRNVLQAFQLIWSEVQSILNGEWSAELMFSRLELPMLKINTNETREYAKSLLKPLFKRAEMIAKQYS